MSIETLSTTPDYEPSVNAPDTYVEQYQLEPHAPVVFGVDEPLADGKEMKKAIGLSFPLVAGIRASGKEFLVLDTRSEWPDQPFRLVDGEYHVRKNASEYKALRDREKVIIGRSREDRFDYPATVSKNHFSIEYREEANGVIITDLGSTNGTEVTGYTDARQLQQNPFIRDDFTRHFGDHVKNEHFDKYGTRDSEAPYGYYNNHPIIGRESISVRDGVYATRGSECVVVDDKNNLVRRCTADFIRELNSDDSMTLSHLSVLKLAEHHTAQIMRYDKQAVDSLSRPHYDNNGLIMMSEYMREGVGVCRHQALLAAHLIEEAIDQGVIAGSVGVERNHDLEVRGAHAWAVYRPLKGDEVIVDPAQHFIGTRKQAAVQGRWKYQLSEVDDRQILG